MKVNVIGTGYVGLVTGVCLAFKGHQVNCYDIEKSTINSINKGIPHIKEAGLEPLLKEVLENGTFIAKHISEGKTTDCDIVLIAVGTPSEEGKIDLSFIESVSNTIAMSIRDQERFVSIVVKSTVLPGTVDTFIRNIIEQVSGKKLGSFGLGMNPEFLREGIAVEDFLNPDRIVLGYDDKETLTRLNQLYEPFKCDKILVNTRTAEMIKYANNCLLATQISAVNELANISSAIKNIDIMEVVKGVHSDKRWNPINSEGDRVFPEILTYLIPGCGFGGSCLPKDLKALQSQSKDYGVEPRVLEAVIKTNEQQPSQVTKLLGESLVNLKDKSILVLGLAFKPGTEDIRESVSINIIQDLLKQNCSVYAHDPLAMENTKREFENQKGIQFIEDWENSIEEVDAVVIATRWEEYRNLSSSEVKQKMKNKILLDARRLFSDADFPESKYLTIGRSLNTNRP